VLLRKKWLYSDGPWRLTASLSSTLPFPSSSPEVLFEHVAVPHVFLWKEFGLCTAVLIVLLDTVVAQRGGHSWCVCVCVCVCGCGCVGVWVGG